MFSETSLMVPVQISANIMKTPTDIILSYCGHVGMQKSTGKNKIPNVVHILGHHRWSVLSYPKPKMIASNQVC